ncbi:MAG TPA: alpha/beta hydrolase [Steroidobacteraceae bacterium]|nr:alpha/beta hydrolase [Steroidobacteraceae bacterium]
MNGIPTDHYYDSADGLKLYCALYAARRPGGLPVLCLPGLTRNSRDFSALAQRLSERHDVLAADLRGRGRSAWDQDSSHYQLPTYVQDAFALLQSRSLSRVLVVGTSLGGLMGMVMAAMQPQLIAGVVLNDVGPEFDPAGIRRIAGYAGKLPPVSSWRDAAAQAKSVYGEALPGLTDEEWNDYARRGYRENAAGIPVPDMDPKIADALRTPPASAPADLWPLYSQIKGVPMLVIRGALSDLLSAATVTRMARENRDVEHVTVANRGHAPLLDEPDSLAAIDAFVARFDSMTGRGG